MKGQNDKILRSPHYVNDIKQTIKYVFDVVGYKRINFSRTKLIQCDTMSFTGNIQKDPRFNNLRNIVLLECGGVLICVSFDIRNNKIQIFETSCFDNFTKDSNHHYVMKNIRCPFLCSGYNERAIDTRVYKGLPIVDSIDMFWGLSDALQKRHTKIKRGETYL